MTDYSQSDQVIALGAIFQGARLARDTAREGQCDADAFATSRNSLFDFEPESVASVFGGPAGIAHGLRSLIAQLERPERRDLEISRYVVSLIHLADRLRNADAEARALRDDLSELARRHEHFQLGENRLNEQLASIYQDRISALGPRIMVSGEPLHLQNPDNAVRIRVSLLTGIRAAVLWRQAGGRKWQLLLKRRSIASRSRELVDALGP